MEFAESLPFTKDGITVGREMAKGVILEAFQRVSNPPQWVERSKRLKKTPLPSGALAEIVSKPMHGTQISLSHADFTEVADNLAEAIANGSDPKMAILEIVEELQLIDAKYEILRRLELSGSDDHRRHGLYFILSGNRYPSRKGYTWA